MEVASLPSLQDLLPVVHVDPTALRHVRTLFYSATKDHEHLANLATRDGTNVDTPSSTGAQLTITITALLPTASTPPSTVPLVTSLSTLTVPLLSNLSNQPPPPRRPTNSLSSLLSLFPPSATCQTSPPLQLHLTLPSVRHRLSNETDIKSSAISLAQNSLAILLTTGQCTDTAGLLLVSRPDRTSNYLQTTLPEMLEPASFNATGDVAGVWVRGEAAQSATLALHALAAAWWTRRNRRLTRIPSTTSNTPEWFERRVWLVRFQGAGHVTTQSGLIAVRNDAGVRYVASIGEGSQPVHFEQAVRLERVAGLSQRHAIAGGAFGHGWRGGWIAVSNGRVPSLNHRTGRAEEPVPDHRGASDMTAPPSRRTRQRESRRHHGVRSVDVTTSQRDIGNPDGEDKAREDALLVARMRTFDFRRRNPVTENAGFSVQEPNLQDANVQGTGQVSNGNNSVQEEPSLEQVNQTQSVSTRIVQTRFLPESDSDGDLSAGDEMNMEELCQKYLNRGYSEEVQRHRPSHIVRQRKQ